MLSSSTRQHLEQLSTVLALVACRPEYLRTVREEDSSLALCGIVPLINAGSEGIALSACQEALRFLKGVALAEGILIEGSDGLLDVTGKGLGHNGSRNLIHSIAWIYGRLGPIYHVMYDIRASLACLQQSQHLDLRLCDVGDSRASLAGIMSNLGLVYIDAGQPLQALGVLR